MSKPADRFRFDPETGLIGIRVGKVELGQHVHEAYELMIAKALGVDAAAVRVLPVSTLDSPDDGLTVGSLSIQVTGKALAELAAELSRALKYRAAQQLNAAPEEVGLDAVSLCYYLGDDTNGGSDNSASCTLFEIAETLDKTLIGSVADSPRGAHLVADAVMGLRTYLQDMRFPDMLHARALRGRDLEEVLPLVPDDTCRIISDGAFAAVLADNESALLALWSQLKPPPASGDRRTDGPVTDWIKAARRLTFQSGESVTAEATSDTTLAVTASRPFLLHGSIAPSCAIAIWQDGVLTVWSHSQGIFPLRAQIEKALGLSSEAVVVHHVPSAGCYGHTAADDAACDAALIAMHAVGRAVRVAWPREDEAWHGPVGAPMLVEANLKLDASHQITAWHQEIWSGPHGQRPGGEGHVNLLAAMERDSDLRPKFIGELPAQIGAGAGRNGVPLYAIPLVAVTTHVVQDLPVRSSSLRGLGTQVNTIAIEAAMDKLAAEIGESPFAVRQRHLDDPRAKAVLDKLQAACADTWEAVAPLPDEAIGIALGRYKNKAAYAAVAAHIRLAEEPQLLRLWAVVDAGQVVGRDGTLNQIEGGMVQAASWTLREGVMLRDGRLDVEGWEDYPTLSWDALPDLEVVLEAPEGTPPLGVGECMVGPTSAAIVNAISALLGETLADLPLDRTRLIEVLSR